MKGTERRKNFGHVVFSRVYHELEVDRFRKNTHRYGEFKFNMDSIMRLLVFTKKYYVGASNQHLHKKHRIHHLIHQTNKDNHELNLKIGVDVLLMHN